MQPIMFRTMPHFPNQGAELPLPHPTTWKLYLVRKYCVETEVLIRNNGQLILSTIIGTYDMMSTLAGSCSSTSYIYIYDYALIGFQSTIRHNTTKHYIHMSLCTRALRLRKGQLYCNQSTLFVCSKNGVLKRTLSNEDFIK